jgi:transposase
VGVEKGLNQNPLQIVMDNLNTHAPSALYEMYGSKEAKRLLQKIQFHYTPAHASWLNVAEIEIGAMDTEYTRKRIPNKETLRREIIAWVKRRNKKQKRIDWRFTRQKADQKLSSYHV